VVEVDEMTGEGEGRVAGFVERVTRGINVRLRSRLLLSMRLCNGCLTPFSCEGGITTPVFCGARGGAGRRLPCACPPCWGIIRFAWREGVAPTEGVRAQSVSGIPMSLLGAMVGTLVGALAGFGGAGRREGGLLDGDAVI